MGQVCGTIDRIDPHGQVNKAFTNDPDMVMSSAIDNERIYMHMYVDTASSLICVHELSNHKQLMTWKHPVIPYFGQSMSVTHDAKLAVGDWPSKQVIIYSLTGDVIKKVPCPPLLTMDGCVCMRSCGDESVIISDRAAGKVVRMSLKDGSLLWSSDKVTTPSGIVHHPAGYVLVASSSTNKTEISVLDEENGRS